jgi:hypothetical protein
MTPAQIIEALNAIRDQLIGLYYDIDESSEYKSDIMDANRIIKSIINKIEE